MIGWGSSSPARWHDKHTYLSRLGMLGTTQLNCFFFFADHRLLGNGDASYKTGLFFEAYDLSRQWGGAKNC